MSNVQDILGHPGYVRLETAATSMAQGEPKKKQKGEYHVLAGQKVDDEWPSCTFYTLYTTEDKNVHTLARALVTVLYRSNKGDYNTIGNVVETRGIPGRLLGRLSRIRLSLLAGSSL